MWTSSIPFRVSAPIRYFWIRRALILRMMHIRMATESALHLADVVFYVMDYNHVQSEINFAFAEQLKDWGKPLYLIVNQIDKHRERELTFARITAKR